MKIEENRNPRVLVIGGSDPTGAAGIQADIKALASVGVFGAAAITAVTSQNSRKFFDRVVMPASVVRSQIEAVFAEIQPKVVKLGMLVNEDIVSVVEELMQTWGGQVSMVLDPVISTSSGKELIDEPGLRLLAKKLIPLAALVTPNRDEAERLTGLYIDSLDDMRKAADFFLAAGASAVLLKGGHFEPNEAGDLVDLLRTLDGEEFIFRHSAQLKPQAQVQKKPDEKSERDPEIQVLGLQNFRGTGCQLASLIAGLLAEGNTLRGAVSLAIEKLTQSMQQPIMGLDACLIQSGLLPMEKDEALSGRD